MIQVPNGLEEGARRVSGLMHSGRHGCGTVTASTVVFEDTSDGHSTCEGVIRK